MSSYWYAAQAPGGPAAALPGASGPGGPPSPASFPRSFPGLAAQLLDRLLAEQLQLTFNQHVSVVVACG